MQTSDNRPTRVHLDHLDGLRGLAALFVVLHHVWQFSFSGYDGGPLPSWWRVTSVFQWGHYAVAVFIVLSGFCLMMPIARSGQIRGGVPGFIRRRARRILPPYYAALALSVICLALVPGLRHQPTGIYAPVREGCLAGAILSHLVLVHNWNADWAFRIDDPMWSVATEWQIYFLLPLALLPLWRRYGTVAPILVATAAGVATDFSPLRPACFWYAGIFAMGMGGAVVCFSPATPERTKQLPWATLGLLSSLLLLSLLLAASKRLGPYQSAVDLLVGAATAFLLIDWTQRLTTSSAGGTSPLLRLLTLRPAVLLGTFSYSLYLIHYPLVSLFQWMLHRQHLTTPQVFLTLVFLGVPLILLCSYVFHLLFERPFMSATKTAASAAPPGLRPIPAPVGEQMV